MLGQLACCDSLRGVVQTEMYGGIVSLMDKAVSQGNVLWW